MIGEPLECFISPLKVGQSILTESRIVDRPFCSWTLHPIIGFSWPIIIEPIAI